MPEIAHHHSWNITIDTYGDPERTKAEQRERLTLVLGLAFGAEVQIREGGQVARALAERVEELEHACRRQLRTGACAEIVAAVGLDTETNGKPVELLDPAYVALVHEQQMVADSAICLRCLDRMPADEPGVYCPECRKVNEREAGI